MCGIFSIYSKRDIKPNSFINSLKELEYRGYDSAGVAFFEEDNIKILKTTLKIKDLESKLKNNLKTSLIMGHTRWATHGSPSIKNCHPHEYKNIVLVHNGIVENYDELKRHKAIQQNKFKSDTDTEVLAHLISYYLEREGSLVKSVARVGEIIKGSNSFLCLDKKDPKLIVAYKNKTPLYLGIKNNGEFLFSSDLNAMKNDLNNYYFLNDEELIEINNHRIRCFNSKMKIKKITMVPYASSVVKKKKKLEAEGLITYDEINSQKFLIPKIFNTFDTIKKEIKTIKNFSEIVIIGCGSSFNASMLGKHYFEQISGIPTAVYRPSEFVFFKKKNRNTLYIFMSQSGETADTCDLLETNAGYFKNSLSIVNQSDSRLVRNTRLSLNLDLGIEKGVAATKTFTGQLIYLYSLAIIFSGKQNKKSSDLTSFNKHYMKIFSLQNKIKDIAKKFHKSKNFFILGRNYNYPIALEASLKIKEIAYIHAEASLSSEMKHGPIALLDKNFPIIFLISNNQDSVLKEITNLYEAKSRSNRILLLATSNVIQKLDKNFLKEISLIEIPNVEEDLLPILFTVPLQYFAYHLAKLNNLSVDQPRNLAKVVTVV
ncbi:MAG: glutamine--fructose-6-phosphate transaminase (isomerizing) [Thermodesulfobacteriota bacterium]|nr:glutamine--fructose-6-phosphate transaminase (isomerizing) [Thermodesulfobacteriota bacterium]